MSPFHLARKTTSPGKLALVAFAAASLSCCGLANAASYQLIYRFQGQPDGSGPRGSLVSDSLGRLYGSTFGGGSIGAGSVYRLTKPASGGGGWTEEILHSFDFADGTSLAAPLLIGSAGEVYGTAGGGGPSNRGVVFKLDNLPGWPITLLHSFGLLPDAGAPNMNGVISGPGGLLYGVTTLGGYKKQGVGAGLGAAFSLSPLGDTVEYAVIHSFGKGSDGQYPLGLALSPTGRLFGVTQQGGINQQGMAFSLQLDVSNAWKETALTQFSSPGLYNPSLPPFLGKTALRRDLFGCGPGGVSDRGVVYRLSPPPDGTSGWTQTILYNFGDKPGDAYYTSVDTCGLTQGADGKLYGTTSFGGTYGDGAFFEVDPPAQGRSIWTEEVLYSFNSSGDRGYNPFGSPLRQGATFYGVAGSTKNGFGGIYKLTP